MNIRHTKNIVLLILGSLFLILSNGRYSFPLAAWLFPVFFLKISRRKKKEYSFYLLPLITGLCLQLSFWKFTYDSPTNILFYLPLILGGVLGFIFYADRFFYSPEDGLITTLYFPLLYTSFEFINNLINPYGTTGLIGYTQFEFLSFAQLASVTGMWGLTFMITWFGSVISWCKDNLQHPAKIKKGVIVYGSILIVLLTYGGVRLMLPLEKSTVRVAGIHTHDKDIEGELGWKYLARKDTAGFKTVAENDIKRLLTSTENEAAAGARIVLWSEISPKILKSEEDSVIKVCMDISKKLKIYLVTTPFSIGSGNAQPENKILLFSPAGQLVLKHFKYGGNFLEGSVEGDKKIKIIETPYGKLSAIICWDADFPSTDRQIGKLQTDILLNPSSDWKEIDPLHSVVAIFRGIENGCSVIRETRNGLSIITDPRGKTITQNDHFSSSSWSMSAEVPNKKLYTLYPLIGDFFGWCAIISLVVLSIVKRKNKH